MKKRILLLSLLCPLCLWAANPGFGDRKYSLTGMVEYSYNTAWGHHANFDVQALMPVNPHVELEAKLQFSHVLEDLRLLERIAHRVGVAAVDHDGRDQFQPFHQFHRIRDVFGTVIGQMLTAAENDMAVAVAAGLEYPGAAVIDHAQERMLCPCRLDGLDGHVYRTVGGILEPDRHRKTAGQLPVRLRFHGSPF